MYERAGFVGTLVWTILQVQNAPNCKELREWNVFIYKAAYTVLGFLSSGN